MTLPLLSALLHGYIGLRLLPDLPPAGAIAVALWLVASTLLVPRALGVRRVRHPLLVRAITWGAVLCLGAFSTLLVLTLLRDAALTLGMVGQWLGLWQLPATAAARSAAAVPLLALAATVIGYVNARRTARVRTVDVPIPGLPPALQGFTIAQITDLHVGPTIRKRQIEGIVERVNALQADVVAVTGDLVDGSVAQLRTHVAPLAGLRARHGAYFVTGNHDYYSGGAEWVAEVGRLGLTVLLNEHVVLRHGEAAVVLAGVADWSAHHFEPAHRSDPLRAVAGAPADAHVRVLLAHQPRSADAAERAGFDLQISGHTHGGQFWPWMFFVRFQQPFTAGLHRLRSLWVYVSRGTGYWGPPKRFGAPSEITQLRLVAA